MKELPLRGRIEDWIPLREVVGIVIFGHIHDDPRFNPDTTEFRDGHRILTSQVQQIESSLQEVKTQNSRYTLGKISDIYLTNINEHGFEDLIPELSKLPQYTLSKES